MPGRFHVVHFSIMLISSSSGFGIELCKDENLMKIIMGIYTEDQF